VTQQQNQVSKQIYQDKHNSAVQNTNPKSEVGKRAENQQDRIGQGIKSGQLTAGEAATSKTMKPGSTTRSATTAPLTVETNSARAPAGQPPAERQSRQIYRDKHNGRHQ